MYVVGDEWHAGNLSYHLSDRPKWFLSIDGKVDKLDPFGGLIYIGNPEILKVYVLENLVKLLSRVFV